MFNTIGICGIGNMGTAMANGLAASGLITPDHIIVFDVNADVMQAMHEKLGVQTAASAQDLTASVDAIIFAVKPNIIDGVLAAVKPHLAPSTVVISIAAGVTIERLQDALSDSTKIIRVMPNTPALVGEGMAALAPTDNVTEQEQADALAIFTSFGRAQLVPERLIDPVCGLSGSGPAYVFMFIEALADGAVLEGMPRDMAYQFAAQTVLGSAKMVLETGLHPGVLKDNVCSPGGTTIEAVRVLEDSGFRAATIEAVIAATEKNKAM